MAEADLVALRKQLEERGLDGFLIPMNDPFQSEYVPAQFRRLEFITGFTGSAGFAIVLKDRAAFFTDGRYTLQARDEVAKEFDIHNAADKTPHAWLKENAPAGARIGFDPWLHTENGIFSFRHAAKEKKLELRTAENPVDAVWTARPRAGTEKIFSHELKFAGIAAREKIAAIIAEMKNQRADALLLTLPESICWLFNIRGRDLPHTPFPLCYALLRQDGGASLYVDREKTADAAGYLRDHQVDIHPLETALDDLKTCKGKRVWLDPNAAPLAISEALMSSGAELIRGADPCLLPKACKNDVELEGARRAHIRDGAALCRFLCWLEKNIGKATELSAAEKLLEFRARGENFSGPSFETISGYGMHGAIVHYRSSAKTDCALKPGALYLLDSGAQYLDGTTDVTRTIALGDPTEEQKQHFTAVLKGHIALATAVFPEGTTGHALDSRARAPLWKLGLDYDHGTGHGVGSFMNVHEGPQNISKRAVPVPLLPGMIISNEPGYYREGQYGIRIENLVAVVERGDLALDGKKFLGFETLTRAPIDLRLVDAAALTPDERNWLNNYHEEVRRTLSPLLTGAEEKKWLERNTVAI